MAYDNKTIKPEDYGSFEEYFENMLWIFTNEGFSYFALPPRKKAGTSFYNSTRDPDEMLEYRKNNPSCNIGIRTGIESNLTVIDVDAPKGGIESLRSIKHLLPEKPTLVVKTPSGFHYYYKYHPDFINGSGYLDGIDIRTEGGYVVAPPSIVTDPDKEPEPYFDEPYTMIRFAEVQELTMSPELYEIFCNRYTKATTTESGEITIAAKPDWIEVLLNGTDEGNRDTEATRLIGTLKTQNIPTGLARELLYKFADKCSPPLEHSVIDEKLVRLYGNIALKTESSEEVDIFQNMQFLDTADWIDEEIPEIDWIVGDNDRGLIPRGALVMLTAFPKAGKTTFTRNLALSVARGSKFLGEFPTRQGLVLYLAVEEYANFVKLALKKQGLTNEDTLLKMKFGMPDKYGIEALDKQIKALKPVLVIIDTVTRMPAARFESGDYFGGSDWLVPYLNMAHDGDDSPAILVNYHSSRNGQALEGEAAISAAIGSTGIIGTVDSMINIKVDSDGHRLFSTVGRFKPVPPIVMEFDRDSESLTYIGAKSEVNFQRIRSELVEQLGMDNWTTHNDWISSVTGDRQTIIAAIQSLKADPEPVIEMRGAGKRGDPFQYRRIPFAISTIEEKLQTETDSNAFIKEVPVQVPTDNRTDVTGIDMQINEEDL